MPRLFDLTAFGDMTDKTRQQAHFIDVNALFAEFKPHLQASKTNLSKTRPMGNVNSLWCTKR